MRPLYSLKGLVDMLPPPLFLFLLNQAISLFLHESKQLHVLSSI